MNERDCICWELRADSWLRNIDVSRADRIAILEQADFEAWCERETYDDYELRARAAMRIVEACCEWTRQHLGQWLLEGRITLSEFLEYLEVRNGNERAAVGVSAKEARQGARTTGTGAANDVGRYPSARELHAERR